MSTSRTLKRAWFPVGHFIGTTAEFLLQACVWPRWVILCWYCCQSLWAPSLSPSSFPLTLLHQKRVLGPCVGSCAQVMCIGNTSISEEGCRWLGIGCCTLFSFLSTRCGCVFSVTVCTNSSALLSAAISAASTDKSNKYLCALWAVLVALSRCWSSCRSLMTWRWPAWF